MIASKIDALDNRLFHKLAYSCPSPVHDFVGREDDLCALECKLKQDGRAILSGMSGIGKTEFV